MDKRYLKFCSVTLLAFAMLGSIAAATTAKGLEAIKQKHYQEAQKELLAGQPQSQSKFME